MEKNIFIIEPLSCPAVINIVNQLYFNLRKKKSKEILEDSRTVIWLLKNAYVEFIILTIFEHTVP